MAHQSVTLLVIDLDPPLAARLEAAAAGLGYTVRTPDLADAAAAGGGCDVVVADLDANPEAGFEVIRQIKSYDPEIEVVLLSEGRSLLSAVRACELSVFAVVQKPVDDEALLARIERAADRRRVQVHNRRLLWELQTINEIAEGVARSLNLDDILVGALQRAVAALSAVGGSIRLRDPLSGIYEVKAIVGSPRLLQMWTRYDLRQYRPSDRVIATRTAVILEDLRALVPPEAREGLPAHSAVSVPMLAGDELLGTLTLGADRAHRFGIADERLLATIARQVAVAVQNARLHDTISRAKREWEETFDAISDPIAVFDVRGELLRGNAALARHLGVPVTALRGQTCRSVGLCGGGEDCVVARALAGETGRAQLASADGRIFSTTAFPVASDRGAAASVVLIAKDVTEEIHSARQLQQMSAQLADANARSTAALERLKATQAQLLQAEKLSAIGQLVAGVAHELNNPLTSVIGYSQLLQEELGEPADGSAQIAADLRRIATEAERAARIVRNLLAFARRQSASREPQDVADLVGRVLALRAYDHRLNGVEVETDFDPDLPPVVADGGQLQQALLNLVLNAEQAMRSQADRRLSVEARFDAERGAVAVSVSDTGHGIDKANASRIFDPFFTTRDVGEGTGLGLSICYGIVRDHGGEIHVESAAGAGARFTIVLPAARALPPREPILVAHADEGERAYLMAILHGWGYATQAAATASEALTLYRAAPVHAAIVDRALLAADLPGWRAARSERREPALILASSSSDDTEVDRFGRDEAAAVVASPYPLRAVQEAMRAATVMRECV